MDSTLAQVLGREYGDELAKALERARHCVAQLSDEQVWWRPAEGMNSVGNLLLHLSGNVRQWIGAGLGGAADDRDRPSEFAERGPIAKDDLLARLDATIAKARAVLAAQAEADWLRVRRVQAHEVTGAAAALHSITHFVGHVQEIVHLTRTQLGATYRFAWVPKSREQGAPHA